MNPTSAICRFLPINPPAAENVISALVESDYHAAPVPMPLNTTSQRSSAAA